jgi:hypothetical protein
MKALHICCFPGTRIPEPPPEPPFQAKRIVRGPDGRPEWEDVTVHPAPPKLPRIRCEGLSKTGRSQCREWSVGAAMYPWGASAYCARHLDEECGPVERTRLEVAPWWESRRPVGR